MKKFILTLVSFLLVNYALLAQGSLAFNGSSNYALIPTSATLDPGTGSYTIETWMYFSSASASSWPRVFQVGAYTASDQPLGLSIENGIFYAWENGSANGKSVSNSNYHDKWVHVAICRSGTTTRMFLDGTMIHSFSSTANIQFGNKPIALGVEYYGTNPSTGTYFNGRLTNFRYIKSALYTSNFTRPTAPFPTTSPTPLILLLANNSSTLLTNSGSFSTTLSNSGVTYSSSTPFGPVISTSTASLTNFAPCSGAVSSAQTFTFTGSNLTSSVTVTAPANFQVSSDGSTFVNSFTVPASGTSIASTTVWVRSTTTASGTLSGSVTLSATNATNQSVSLSGDVLSTPVLTVTNGSRCGTGTVTLGATSTQSGTVSWFSSLSGGSALATGTSYTTPSISTTTTYYVSGSNICFTSSPRQAVTATINEVPTISGSSIGYVSQQTLLTGSGTPASSSTWATSNSSIATVSGTNSATGTVTGIATGSATITYRNSSNCTSTSTITVYNPTITTSTSSLSAFAACSGSASTTQTFTVSGTSIPTNILVTAPTGFEISTSAGSGFTGSLTLNAISGTVGSTTIYVRMSASATGTPSGSIDITSNQATSKVVSVSGTLSTVPTISVTDGSRCGAGTVVLSATATQSGTLDWYATNNSTTSLHTGATYQPTVALGTTTYYVEASNSCGSSVSRSAVVATAYAIPDAPTVTNGQRCGTGTVALSATTVAGNTIRWYASGGSTVLATGTSYTTPSITSTTDYDVDVVSADGCASATKATATATVSNTATWNSASSQSWTTAGNWSCGTVPDGSLSLVISTGTATLSSDLSMASGTTLTLASGAQLVIEPGHALTVQDGATLSNAGTLVVDANSTAYAQLLLQGTYTKVSSGKVQVKGYYDVDGNTGSPWVHVSSPVAGALAQLGTVTTGNTQGWRASTASWIGMRTDSTFKAGKGYVTYIGTNGVAAGPTGTFTLEGDPFNNVTPRLDYNNGSNSNASFVDANNRGGWNLLGNPFTCNLDYVALQTTIAGLNTSFARWNPKKGGPGQGGFDVHAPAGVGVLSSAVIPPMGAAWVQTSAATAPVASGTLKHKDHGRRNSRNFSKGAGVDKLLIKVSELASPQIQDEMTLAMVPGAQDGFDSEWDGRELLNSLYMPNIYSKFDQDKISAKAVDFNLDAVNAKAIAVGMTSTQEMKPYRIHLDESWAQPGYTVYLKDHLLKNVHKLSTSDYVFAYSSWMEDRFELILTNAKTGALGLEEASRGALTAWVSGSELWITGLESGAQELDVVGMDGRVVLSSALRGEEGQPATTALPELPAGLYTVRVRANGLERGVRFAVSR